MDATVLSTRCSQQGIQTDRWLKKILLQVGLRGTSRAQRILRHQGPGSGGSDNVISGALVPHGMVRASPDTVDKGGQIDAYHYASGKLAGFTHTHLEGRRPSSTTSRRRTASFLSRWVADSSSFFTVEVLTVGGLVRAWRAWRAGCSGSRLGLLNYYRRQAA